MVSKTFIFFYSIPGENDKKDPFRQRKKYSTKLDDLEYLPLDLCRQYLKVRVTSLCNTSHNLATKC